MECSINSLQTIPEIRDVFKVARLYLEDEASIIELHGVVVKCTQWAYLAKLSPEIVSVLEEWRTMTYNRWNEWGDAQHPSTEEDFRVWLEKQLVFET